MPLKRPVYIKLDARKLTAADYHRIVPLRLYKYRAANDFFFNMLETGSLWFSRPADFNDPFDCRLKLNLGNDKKNLEANLVKAGLMPKFTNAVLRKNHRKMMSDPVYYNRFMTMLHHYVINSRLSVCCFAENPDNLLLWAHYAASHTGVCLDFSMHRKGFMYANLLPVQYKYRYPVFDIRKFGNEPRIFYAMHQHAVCTKSLHWEYEREWRVVLDEPAGAKPFEKSHLRRIIFGVNTPANIVAQTRRLLRKNGYAHTRLALCVMKENSFGISIQPLQP